jgi:hypothetical protein
VVPSCHSHLSPGISATQDGEGREQEVPGWDGVGGHCLGNELPWRWWWAPLLWATPQSAPSRGFSYQEHRWLPLKVKSLHTVKGHHLALPSFYPFLSYLFFFCLFHTDLLLRNISDTRSISYMLTM